MYTDIGDAELLESGYLIYNGAAYTNTCYSPAHSPEYADVYALYAELFPDADINVINPPLGAINIVNPLVAAMVADQGEILDKMEANIYGDVNFVNLKEIFIAHRGEYLYFKSDFHWTQLGAYYAYCGFAKSKGLTPAPLSEFEEVIVTDSFIGRSNDYAKDPKDRIKTFIDTVYAYMPRKAHTMEIYDADLNLYKAYDSCIQPDIKNYSCFTCGDNPYIVIDVPENDPEHVVLVIKESSGNAFVPFLTEHYGRIIIIDPRPFDAQPDISKIVAENGVDDIIFFAMASTANGAAYCNYYRKLIGK